MYADAPTSSRVMQVVERGDNSTARRRHDDATRLADGGGFNVMVSQDRRPAQQELATPARYLKMQVERTHQKPC